MKQPAISNTQCRSPAEVVWTGEIVTTSPGIPYTGCVVPRQQINKPYYYMRRMQTSLQDLTKISRAFVIPLQSSRDIFLRLDIASPLPLDGSLVVFILCFFTILNQKEFRIATVAMFTSDLNAGVVPHMSPPPHDLERLRTTMVDFIVIFNRGRRVVSWTFTGRVFHPAQRPVEWAPA